MIIMKNGDIGFYWQLQKGKDGDFHGDWKGFLAAAKKLRTVTYQPAELDDPVNWWYCGNVDLPTFRELYKKYIGKVLLQIKEDRKAGLEPLKRKGWKR